MPQRAIKNLRHTCPYPADGPETNQRQQRGIEIPLCNVPVECRGQRPGAAIQFNSASQSGSHRRARNFTQIRRESAKSPQ